MNSESQALVSIIMPIFQPNPRDLRKSLLSILDQTYDNLELLAIIDRCDDSSDKFIHGILSEYKDDHRLKTVSHNIRKGLVACLNEGISISRGNYLARADCDDFSFPNRIEYQLDYLISNSNDLVGSWAFIVDLNGQIKGKLILPVSHEEIRRSMLRHNMILHGSVLMKKKAVKSVGLYHPAFYRSEDYELWFRMLSFGLSFGNCPSFLLCLRENPNSITRGSAWLSNRFAYFKSKAFACFRYGFLRPMDISFFLASIPFFLIHPSTSISLKRLFGLFKTVNLSNAEE